MNLFEAKSIYDSNSGKFLEEFYINSNSVDCDEYYFYLEREKDVEDNKLEYKEKELVKEKAKENPYIYEDEVCECDECKYKDKKKYESCNDDCKYMNCDECCNDFCDCENDCCEECEGCKVEGFDYGELLEIFTKRIQDTGGCPECIKEILDEFADIFIPDYDEDEIDIQDEECECQGCNECIDCDEVECENQISSEKLEELKLIAHFTDEVLKREGCPECTFELLADLYIKGKNIGWNNHKEFMRELMGEALEE